MASLLEEAKKNKIPRWQLVGAIGPDGHENFFMRLCDSCDRPVDICYCLVGDEESGKHSKGGER